MFYYTYPRFHKAPATTKMDRLVNGLKRVHVCDGTPRKVRVLPENDWVEPTYKDREWHNTAREVWEMAGEFEEKEDYPPNREEEEDDIMDASVVAARKALVDAIYKMVMIEFEGGDAYAPGELYKAEELADMSDLRKLEKEMAKLCLRMKDEITGSLLQHMDPYE